MNTARWKIFDYLPPQEPLKVLYVDEDVLVISKPHGLLSVPGKPAEHWDCVEYRARQLYSGVRVVHRLDSSTSGIMVMALNPKSLREMGRQFEQRKVEKIYIARVWGDFLQDQGEIDLPLICDWPNRPLQKVDYEIGKPSQTLWRVINCDAGISRVELRPLTGRSHQLRVHMMCIGHPILGDEFYATDEAFFGAERLQLHASLIKFRHPEDDRIMIFEDTPPF